MEQQSSIYNPTKGSTPLTNPEISSPTGTTFAETSIEYSSDESYKPPTPGSHITIHDQNTESQTLTQNIPNLTNDFGYLESLLPPQPTTIPTIQSPLATTSSELLSHIPPNTSYITSYILPSRPQFTLPPPPPNTPSSYITAQPNTHSTYTVVQPHTFVTTVPTTSTSTTVTNDLLFQSIQQSQITE